MDISQQIILTDDVMRSRLSWMVVGWLFLVAVLLWHRIKARLPGSSGPLIYASLFSLNHLFGGFIYCLPWYEPQHLYLVHGGWSVEMTYLGFIPSVQGFGAFVVGVLAMDRLLLRRAIRFARAQKPRVIKYIPVLLSGLMFSVVLSPLLGSIPSVGALVSAGQRLATIGFILAAWTAWKKGNNGGVIRWIGASLIFPITSTVMGGFIGFGTASFIMVVVFSAPFVKQRLLVVVSGLLLTYLGLSVWVTYSRDREEIRDVVWGNQGMDSRASRVFDSFSDWEFFDITDNEHLERIDMRLNQNHFVGRSVDYMSMGGEEFAKGETIWFALISWIPRIVWPGKPTIGGSGSMVSDYTGMTMSENSSFGVGQILELYFNFGHKGVVVGMFLLGCLIRYLDIKSGICLDRRNLVGFILWVLPMLVMIQPNGSMAEVVSSCVSAGILSVGLNVYFKFFESRRKGELLSETELNREP